MKVKLLVSHWNTEEPAIHHLKSLAMLPEVEVRIATLPRASEGFIPFARVIHTKAMTIDGELAWVDVRTGQAYRLAPFSGASISAAACSSAISRRASRRASAGQRRGCRSPCRRARRPACR